MNPPGLIKCKQVAYVIFTVAHNFYAPYLRQNPYLPPPLLDSKKEEKDKSVWREKPDQFCVTAGEPYSSAQQAYTGFTCMNDSPWDTKQAGALRHILAGTLMHYYGAVTALSMDSSADLLRRAGMVVDTVILKQLSGNCSCFLLSSKIGINIL